MKAELQLRPVVGVMGSGRRATSEAAILGQLLAQSGCHLLTGGGGGQMEAVAQSFVEAELAPDQTRGLSIGVLPSGASGAGASTPGYPNRFVELPIQTHLWRRGGASDPASSRNSINVLTSQVLLFVWGEEGTLNEAELADTYGRPSRLFLKPETRAALPCSELVSRFRGRTLDSVSEVEAWLGGFGIG